MKYKPILAVLIIDSVFGGIYASKEEKFYIRLGDVK